jgi:hypothetical protein
MYNDREARIRGYMLVSCESILRVWTRAHGEYDFLPVER